MAGAEDLEGLAEDWIALWQSEIAGMAADRETAEAWAAWAAMAAAWMRAASTPQRPPVPPALMAWLSAGNPLWPGMAAHDGAPPPPRPEAAADASRPQHDAGRGGEHNGPLGGADAERALLHRIAELERRLADLERGQGGGGADTPRPRGRRPRR
jgi:hypothetical protein